METAGLKASELDRCCQVLGRCPERLDCWRRAVQKGFQTQDQMNQPQLQRQGEDLGKAASRLIA